jgi:hypothetical protein
MGKGIGQIMPPGIITEHKHGVITDITSGVIGQTAARPDREFPGDSQRRRLTGGNHFKFSLPVGPHLIPGLALNPNLTSTWTLAQTE